MSLVPVVLATVAPFALLLATTIHAAVKGRISRPLCLITGIALFFGLPVTYEFVEDGGLPLDAEVVANAMVGFYFGAALVLGVLYSRDDYGDY